MFLHTIVLTRLSPQTCTVLLHPRDRWVEKPRRYKDSHFCARFEGIFVILGSTCRNCPMPRLQQYESSACLVCSSMRRNNYFRIISAGIAGGEFCHKRLPEKMAAFKSPKISSNAITMPRIFSSVSNLHKNTKFILSERFEGLSLKTFSSFTKLA